MIKRMEGDLVVKKTPSKSKTCRNCQHRDYLTCTEKKKDIKLDNSCPLFLGGIAVNWTLEGLGGGCASHNF